MTADERQAAIVELTLAGEIKRCMNNSSSTTWICGRLMLRWKIADELCPKCMANAFRRAKHRDFTAIAEKALKEQAWLNDD